MNLNLRELLFFSSLFGVVVFYPVVWHDFVTFLTGDYNFFVLFLASLLLFFGAWIFIEKRKERKWDAFQFLVGFIAIIFVGLGVNKTSPVFALWFLSAGLTLLSFIYMATYHLFKKAERDFIKRWKEFVFLSLGINLLRLILVFALAFFPVSLVAFIMAVFMLILRR